jgi:catechol 2,3-dioxygenase-like lactoylglutathione lyase family enzyme
MKKTLLIAVLGLCVAAAARPASAQLLADGPIVYGHHHLNVSSVEATKKFFVDTLGGKAVKIGTNNTEVVEFPNVLIFFRTNQAPTGGTRGTTVNHIGFSVPNLRATVDKVKASGYQMITQTEASSDRVVKDDIAGPPPAGGSSIAFVQAPDDLKVELVEAKQQTTPVALHHLHFFNPSNTEMQAWYVKTFGAVPGTRRGSLPTDGSAQTVYLAADLPGMNINFLDVDDKAVPTKGRMLDHIGFEVRDLQAFTRTLAANGVNLVQPYRRNSGDAIATALLVDPWGTSIELTEGLSGY